MREWIREAAAATGLLMFMVSVFGVADIAPALLGIA